MSYTVYLHPNVVKFLRKLPESDVQRIRAKLTELINPYSVRAVKLKGNEAFRIRVGGYRILYTVDDDRKVVVVFKVDRRDRVYSRV